MKKKFNISVISEILSHIRNSSKLSGKINCKLTFVHRKQRKISYILDKNYETNEVQNRHEIDIYTKHNLEAENMILDDEIKWLNNEIEEKKRNKEVDESNANKLKDLYDKGIINEEGNHI